jgi:hypothetical protein
MRQSVCTVLAALLLAAAYPGEQAAAQGQAELIHSRGRIWENVANDGWIGSLGAWDYLVSAPLGLFPGFTGFQHPLGNENNAINAFANANMHNFRSGVWIVAKDMNRPGPPPIYAPTPTAYELYTSGLQEGAYGIEQTRAPLQLMENFIENAGFEPLLPEEMITATWNTSVGITITRRSSTWSYPGFRDFIIYDYIFKNTGLIVSTQTQQVVSNPQDFQQTLSGVYFVVHSAISVSTKSQINFHSELTAVQAGAFGWLPGAYHDYYHIRDGGELLFSTNANGGKEPLPDDPYPTKPPDQWQQRFGQELQSPAAFGWLSLYASPVSGGPRPNARPDVLRIDSHKGGIFNGASLDLERFTTLTAKKPDFYLFASTPDTQVALGNSGRRFNFYTLSYGPYTIAPGDSVRIIVAEIAGVMDIAAATAGDPDGWFPDSSIAAIERNARNARNAVAWGMGATVQGVPLAADAPEPPPMPATDAVNASAGLDTAAIAVVWSRNAEEAVIADGSGGTFFDGSVHVDGYRVYRSRDFQYVSETELPAFRGESWELLADIPKSQFASFFDQTLGKYRFVDNRVTFGFRYGYYVAAYRLASPGATWTSANGTVVTGLPELESGSAGRTSAVTPAPGPSADLSGIFVAPNPYVFGDVQRSFAGSGDYVEFRNLPERCTIRIYTIGGDLVKTLEHQPDSRGNLFGSERWDQLKTDSGLQVAPGLYVYNVESKTPGLEGSYTGKLMIIR